MFKEGELLWAINVIMVGFIICGFIIKIIDCFLSADGLPIATAATQWLLCDDCVYIWLSFVAAYIMCSLLYVIQNSHIRICLRIKIYI